MRNSTHSSPPGGPGGRPGQRGWLYVIVFAALIVGGSALAYRAEGGATAYKDIPQTVVPDAGATDEEIRRAAAIVALTRHWNAVLSSMQVDFEMPGSGLAGDTDAVPFRSAAAHR